MPRSRSQAEVDDFKQRLCTAAERLLLTRGSRDFTMRELADEVGCSSMLPYRYYRDKDEIVAAVRTNAFGKFAAALEAPRTSQSDAAAGSRGVGEAYIAFAFAHPELYRLMFTLEPVEPGRYPELDAAIVRARQTMTAHVQDLVRLGLLKGDPEVIGHVFWASLHGLIVLQLAKQLAPEPGFGKIREAMLQALVRGMQPPH